MIEADDLIQLMNLSRKDDLSQQLDASQKIEFRKQLEKMISDSKKESKQETCYNCNNKVSSHCNSHTVPISFLKNIAVNGEVYYSNKLIGLAALDDDKGIKKAGTFNIICNDCDRDIFKDYEDEEKLKAGVSAKIIAQIAMKNFLKSISKRFNESKLYEIIGDKFDTPSLNNHMQEICNLDLTEFEKGFKKAKRASEKNWNDIYSVIYYEVLDYVVPIAYQGSIAMVADLDDSLINDIYHKDPKYKIQELHLCVFPLKSESVVIMFNDRDHKKYRKFAKEFSKLDQYDKLSLINYLIFLYTEDYFVSKSVNDEIINSSELSELAGKTTIAFIPSHDINPLEKTVTEFSLKNRIDIPNFLLRK